MWSTLNFFSGPKKHHLKVLSTETIRLILTGFTRRLKNEHLYSVRKLTSCVQVVSYQHCSLYSFIIISGISGVTYRLVQGVVKNIIPAVASTNAVIAAACVTEAFKLATSCCSTLNNYMTFCDIDGIYTYTYENERREDCLVCSPASRPKYIDVPHDGVKLSEFIDILCNDQYQMKSPAIVVEVNAKTRTLYMSNVPSIEERTRENLKKTLKELDLVNGSKLLITDSTNPSTLEIVIRFSEMN